MIGLVLGQSSPLVAQFIVGGTGVPGPAITVTPQSPGLPVSVANGGTGLASYTVGDLIVASGTTTLTTVAAVAAGRYLRSNGVGAAPLWSTLGLPNAATAGDLFTATAANTMGVLAVGGAGTVLIGGTTPTYSSSPSATTLALGTNPSTSGALRLASGDIIGARNAANTANFGLIRSNGAQTDNVQISDTTAAEVRIVHPTAGTTIYNANGAITTTGSAATYTLGTAASASGAIALANGAGGGALWTIASGATSAWTVTSPATAPAQGALLTFSNGTGQLASVADVATGQVLTSGGLNTVPAYSATPTVTTMTATTANATGSSQINGILLCSATAPTVTGFGTSPSVPNANGTCAFTIDVGTGGTASTGSVTLPAATTGWVLSCYDVTTPASFITSQTGGTTTTATVTNYSRTTGAAIAWTASDILRCSAHGY